MAKRKSRQNSAARRREYFGGNANLKHEDFKHSSVLRENLKRQTRDYPGLIANSQLSFAEDLRRYSPDRNKFHNVDGSISQTTYKPVPVQKKNIVHRLVLCGVTCLVSFILGVLLCASVEVYANKYYSLIKFW